jgi:hypothetical protein
MSISVVDATVRSVEIDSDVLRVGLADGRVLSTPLTWFPRLAQATPAERSEWRLIGRGEGIHWEALDEDVSVAGLLRTS